jgi:hypothetical protein
MKNAVYHDGAMSAEQETAMVGSYLICDACGQFGPPASFLSENGLRLCYRCWYQERLNDESPAEDGTEAAPRSPVDPARSDDRSDGE